MPKPKSLPNRGLPARWRLRFNAYYYRVPKGFEHYWDNKTEFKLGNTLPEAHQEFARRFHQQATSQVHTVSQLCDRYQHEVVPKKSPATQRSNLLSLERIRKVFEKNAIASIEPSHIYQYRDHVALTKSEKQANLDLEVLSHMFTKSIEWGIRNDHPMTGKKVTKFSMKPRDRYVSDIEIRAFMDILPIKWQLYIVFKLYTGLRKGDLLSIKLSDINQDGIKVTANKTGKSTLYLPSEEANKVLAQILNLKRPRNAEHLFCNRKGMPYIKENKTTSGFDSMWQRNMRKALDEGIVQEKFTENDLRRKAASDTNLEHAKELLQHSSENITKRVYRPKGEEVKTR